MANKKSIYPAKFDLSFVKDREKFGEICQEALMAGDMVVLDKQKKKRTTNQNSYLHLIFGWFAHETGYTREEVKERIFKRLICKDIFVVEDNRPIKIIIGNKEGRKRVRSSTELSTGEMTIAIEKFRNWSADPHECPGIYLPSPQEQDHLTDIQRMLGRYGTAQYL